MVDAVLLPLDFEIGIHSQQAVVVGGRVGPAVFDNTVHVLQSDQMKWQVRKKQCANSGFV